MCPGLVVVFDQLQLNSTQLNKTECRVIKSVGVYPPTIHTTNSVLLLFKSAQSKEHNITQTNHVRPIWKTTQMEVDQN